MRCTSASCGKVFPLVREVPVILNDERSVLSTAALVASPRSTYSGDEQWAKRIARLLPSNSRNLCRKRAYARLAELLAVRGRPIDVLVIGSGDRGMDYGQVSALPAVRILEVDVSLEGDPALVCDAHDLPFEDASFDLVVCEAVLEHVFDPRRCVAEMHRILRPGGLVFATTPFMQQVHMGAYDFQRFSRSGHRALFASFEEIESGMATGPASVLVWSVEYFLLAWTGNVWLRRIAKGLTRLLLGWLTLLDHLLARRESALDGAGGFYFIGRSAAGAVFGAKDAVAYYAGCDDAR
jgi:SAM-dependent methyltransferase